jgi:uncharacterized protein YjdB
VTAGLLTAGCGQLIATIAHPLGVAAAAERGPLQTFLDTAPANVSVYPAGLSIGKGQRQALRVRAADQDGQAIGGPVTYVSRSPGTIAVAADGTLSAVAPGKADVVVAVGGTAIVVPVTVTGEPAALRPNEVRIAGPGALRVDALGALAEPLAVRTEIQGPVAWKSLNPKVATVDADGRVTALANGVAMITANVNGVASAPFALTVKQRPFRFRLSAGGQTTHRTTAQGAPIALSASIEDGNQTPIVPDGYRIDVPGVAAVDKAGNARGKAGGQTLIRPLAGGLAAPDRGALTFAVDQAVQPTPMGAGGMDVYPGRLALAVGAKQALVAQARDADGAVIRPAFQYSAEPAGIVSVDAQGLVTALKAGQATVRVAGHRTARAVAVTVTEPAAGNLRLAGAHELATASLGALPLPIQASAEGVRWESSDPGVATVDPSGRVVAVADGRVTLTAVSGTDRASVVLVVDQRPAYLAVHNNLPGDPREVVLQENMASFGLSATAFDFNGNAMRIERLVTDNDQVAFATNDYVRTYSGGSAYVRAVCKGVRSNNANSVLVCSMAPFSNVRPNGAPDGTGAAYSLQVQQAAVNLAVGGTLALTVTVRDGSGAATTAVTPSFDVDDPTVASVDANGVVTGLAAGTATVTVSIDGASVTVPVTVSIPVNPDLVVNPTSLSTNALGPISPQLTYTTALPGTPSWTTSDAGVATVDASGNVTATGNGTATITATLGPTSTPVTVTVDQRATFVRVDSAVSGNPRTVGAFVGETFPLTATVRDANNNAMTVDSWEVAPGDQGVITVAADGTVTAVGAGTAFVRAVTRGNVTSTDAQSIAFTVEARTLSAAPNPMTIDRLGVFPTKLAVTTNQSPVSFASSDTSVLTVAADGTITALKNGTATVTVTAGTVMAPLDVPVTVAQKTASLLISSTVPGDPRAIVFSSTGDTVQLTAVARDANGNAIATPGWFSWNTATFSVAGLTNAPPGVGVASVADTDGSMLVVVKADGSSAITVTTADGVTSTAAQGIAVVVDINNAGSVDTTINLP